MIRLLMWAGCLGVTSSRRQVVKKMQNAMQEQLLKSKEIKWNPVLKLQSVRCLQSLCPAGRKRACLHPVAPLPRQPHPVALLQGLFMDATLLHHPLKGKAESCPP